jgi:hypothetical protein
MAPSRDLDVDPSVGLPSINIGGAIVREEDCLSLYKARWLIRSFSGCGPATQPYTVIHPVSTKSDEDYTAEE